jgi:DNA-binding CsgD family transcriptional regulator
MWRVLIGRAADLDRAQAAVAARRPVVVSGEAGAGKTSVLRSVAGTTGREVLEGGALSTLSWLEYLPLTRALGHEIAGRDESAVAQEVLAAAGDRVLLLDDLQWASPALLTVVGALAGSVQLLLGVRSGPERAAVVATVSDAEVVDLGPLLPDAATRVVRSARPELSSAQVSSVVAVAGGNPLLLRELAVTGESSPSLRHTVAARLRQLGAAERDVFELLALAGRPLRLDWLDPTLVNRLAAVGLVDISVGQVAVRHSLLAQAAIDGLTVQARQSVHRELAGLVEDAGEGARHAYLAGDSVGACELALEAADAATLPGERASHLRLAGMTSTGEHADELRLAAARALEEASDAEAVFEVLDTITGRSDDVVAAAALIRVRAAWLGGRSEEVRPSLERGLAAAARIGGELLLRLQIEACRIPIFMESDFVGGAEMARAALATATGVDAARARYFLGTALACLDDDEGAVQLQAAIDGARVAGDLSTELTATNNLISYQESSGTPGLGANLARSQAARARVLGLGHWESSFAYQALQLDFHAGSYVGLVEAAELLEQRPLDYRARDALLEVHAMALVDTGRADEAVRLARDAMAAAVGDHVSRIHFWWVLAEAALWTGDPAGAVTYADRYLAEIPPENPNMMFGVVTRAWGRFDQGLDPEGAFEAVDRPMLFGLPHELTALRACYLGRHLQAVDELRTAAVLWAPYHVRGALRCECAVGEVLLRAGLTDDAVCALEMVEKRSADIGLLAVHHRAVRLLRSAGERRSTTPRRAVGGLTARELQVLALVGRGLTNDQVAARLGISRRTVETQISTASVKLGATSRVQAATMAAGLA